ncbi:MAG: DUF2933 domain-containing protein [Methylovirgula sp.]
METTTPPIVAPNVRSSSCHGANQGANNWISRRRGLIFGGAAIVAATAFALTQHWLTIIELEPLLFVLPCAAMMLMCMKGMNHGQQASPAPSSADADKSIGTDFRN